MPYHNNYYNCVWDFYLNQLISLVWRKSIALMQTCLLWIAKSKRFYRYRILTFICQTSTHNDTKAYNIYSELMLEAAAVR